MNEDQARIIRVYQYLLSKETFLRHQVIENQKAAQRIKPLPDEIFALWYSMVKIEFWQEIAGELWNLLK